MTDRKLTCIACKSAITEGDIAHSDLEFGGELKATNQPEYTADADTDLVATVGTLDEYTPMIRNTGNQTKSGVLIFETASVVSIDAPKDSTTRKAWPIIKVIDKGGDSLLDFFYVNTGTGSAQLEARMFKIDGTFAGIVLGTVTL